MSAPKPPSTIGEWDAEIEQTSDGDLKAIRLALAILKAWKPFNAAFAWTRIFVLEQSIGFELERRERNAKS